MFKKIAIGLIGLVVLLALIGFLLPGKIEVAKSVSINAPAEYAFEEINNIDNWKKWSYWNTLDPEMKMNFGDVRVGAGALYSWDGPDVGQGKMTIAESVPNSSIKIDLDFLEQGTAKAWYTFEPENEGTKLTMGFASETGWNPIARWAGVLFAKPMMNKAFDYNLAKVKELAEAKPKFSVKITEENTQPVNYIGLNHTMSPKDTEAIGAQMGKMYGELFGVLTKSKIQPTGQPFCLFPRFTQESMDMVCALPVPADAKLPTKYKIQQTPGGKAVKAIHLGNYDKLETTHNEINKYIEFKKLEISGAPWEVYVTDPTVEKDPAKWVTEVYYPVKQ